jgi:ankyrin repeat protein
MVKINFFTQIIHFRKKQEENNELLLEAVEVGDVKKVKELFSETNLSPPNINSRFMDQFTCLHYAAQDNFYPVAVELVKYGSNINALSSMRRTPLMYAVISGHREIVEMLLKNKADVNIKDTENNTVAHFASENGFKEILKMLLK